MGVGYSVPKESSLRQFLAISLESPEILGVIEPKAEKHGGIATPVTGGNDGEPNGMGALAREGVGEGQDKAEAQKQQQKECDSLATGLVHRMVRKHWHAGVDRVLRRGPQLTVHLGDSPFSSSSPSFGSPSANELASVRDFLCRLIALLEGNFRLEASPYLGKMFVRNTMIFSSINSEFSKNGAEKKCHYREYALDPSECVIWIGIRSKNVLQLPQSALGQCSHCCPPPITAESEEEAALLHWIRTEFSGSKIVHCPNGTSDCPAHNRPRFTEIHFQGQPFGTQKFEELITTRRLFLGLFRHFLARGFTFCAQLSVRGCGKNDTVIFRKLDPASNQIVQKQIFLLSFESKFHLRLFECPPEAAKAIEESFSEQRIKQIRPSWMGCSEIVFGLPLFWTDQSQLLDTQLAIIDMFGALWRIGWKFAGSSQIGQFNQDKTSIVFQSTDVPAPTRLFGLSTGRADQLRLLDAPASIRSAIRVMLEAEWEKGVQEEVPTSSERIFVFKLRGRPWSCRDNSLESTCGLHLLVFICERLHRMGWQLLCSLDAGAKVNDDDDAHLFCEDGELLVFYGGGGGGERGGNDGPKNASAPPAEKRDEEEEGEEGELDQIAKRAAMARMGRMSTL